MLHVYKSHSTVEAVKAREKARQLKKKRDEEKQKGKKHQEELKAAQEELTVINNKIKSIKGPFQTKFDNTLEELNLKRQIYPNGALRGERYRIGRREKWSKKVGRREKSGRKCREEGEK